MSNSPEGKLYIGFAYNRTTAVESDTASDYVWSLIKGTDGVPGAPGADGVTTYTWIKYSDNADGTGLYDIPTDSTEYIGIATNKTTATESAEKSDYRWSKFKGDQGVAGEKGADGVDGAVFEHRYAKNGSTSTAPALDAAAVDPPGWTTILPSVGDLEYLWMTTAEKSAAGDLLQNWSAPVRASGVDGTYVENRYWVHDSYNYPSVPAPGEPDFYSYLRGEDEPAGWRTSLPSTSPGRYIFMLSGRKTAAGNLIGPWAGVTRLTGISGKDGADGKSPALVYRGEYSSSETYYGTSVRVDAVKHGSTYYVARVDAGTFTNYVPTSAVKWNTFGAQFDSIATGLLIAETANIASWIFTNQQIESQDGKVCLNGANGTMSFGTDSNMTISTDPSNRMNARVAFSIKGSVVGEIGFSTYPYLRFYDGRRYAHLKGAQLQLYVSGASSNGINLYVDSDGSSNVSFDKLPTSEPTAQDTVWRDSNGYLRIT
jgi:hypothetical protein